jgi:hypothetical protein
MTHKDQLDLERAVALLESPSFIARLADAVGAPIEMVFRRLPSGATDKISVAVQGSLRTALNVALKTLPRGRSRRSVSWAHSLAVGATGAAGGAFGLPALAIELPVTTTVILRAVADIASSEGEDLESVSGQLACLEVLAIGGRTSADDAVDSAYFAVRAALAQAVTDAARYVAQRATVEESAPVLVRLLAQIASRFNTVVAEKIMAQGVPIVGALGGATINVLFIDHFQDMARGHFTVRRLERIYGPEQVRSAYAAIRRRDVGPGADAGVSE